MNTPYSCYRPRTEHSTRTRSPARVAWDEFGPGNRTARGDRALGRLSGPIEEFGLGVVVPECDQPEDRHSLADQAGVAGLEAKAAQPAADLAVRRGDVSAKPVAGGVEHLQVLECLVGEAHPPRVRILIALSLLSQTQSSQERADMVGIHHRTIRRLPLPTTPGNPNQIHLPPPQLLEY